MCDFPAIGVELTQQNHDTIINQGSLPCLQIKIQKKQAHALK